MLLLLIHSWSGNQLLLLIFLLLRFLSMCRPHKRLTCTQCTKVRNLQLPLDYFIANLHGSYMTGQVGCGSSVGCSSAWYADGRGFDSHVWQHSFVEVAGHVIISKATLTLPLIQKRAVVSYWRKNVHQVLVNCLGSLPRKSVDRLIVSVRNDKKSVEGP